jgi:periplasmic protein TonB
MTVRQAFYISIAAHIMVFGSAFAVARYGRAPFLSSGDTIMVTLVSPGLTSGNERGAISSHVLAVAPITNQVHAAKNKKPTEPITNQVDAAKNEKPTEQAMNQVNAAKTEMATEGHMEPDAESMQLSGHTTKNGNSGIDGLEPAQSASGTGHGIPAQFGVTSPEEWALLAAAIERTKNYPRLARERGIEGVVRLRFRLNSSGTVEKIEIVQSSGSEILDSASISAVYRAAPMPYVNGWVEIPMKYVLK